MLFEEGELAWVVGAARGEDCAEPVGLDEGDGGEERGGDGRREGVGGREVVRYVGVKIRDDVNALEGRV